MKNSLTVKQGIKAKRKKNVKMEKSYASPLNNTIRLNLLGYSPLFQV
jgi:hypothetical protein